MKWVELTAKILTVLVFISWVTHVLVERWASKWIEREIKQEPLKFKVAYSALPMRKRQALRYIVSYGRAGRWRRTSQLIGMAIAAPFLAIYFALAALFLAAISIEFWLGSLKHWILRPLTTPEYRAEKAEEAMLKIHETIKDPQSVRLMTMMKDMPPVEDIEFAEFMRTLLGKERSYS